MIIYLMYEYELIIYNISKKYPFYFPYNLNNYQTDLNGFFFYLKSKL